MLGTCFPLFRPPAPAVLTSHSAGAMNGRTLASLPPASPRISRHSTWWAAFTQGGFRGLHHWIVRTRQDRGLSIEERESKPEEIALAIRLMLQIGETTSPQWTAALDARLDDARWYGVDGDKVVGAALSQMTPAKLAALTTACAKEKSLDWLARNLDARQAASLSMKSQLSHALENSMALSMDGFPIRGARQNTLWDETARFFASSFGCNLEESVHEVITYATLSKILPLAKNYLGGETKNLTLLNEVCKQAFTRINGWKAIPWSSLSDSELDMYSELVKHDDLKNLATALKVEIQRRDDIAKCNEVESYVTARLSELAANPEPGQEANQSASERLPYPKLCISESANIVASVIARAAPETVLSVAKMTSASSRDNQLIDAANVQLKKPAAKFLDHACLIAYLKLPEESISASARELLETEAQSRAKTASVASMNILSEGINSGSYRKLVGTVLEFAKLDKMKADLLEAAIVDLPPGSETITEFFSKLDTGKIFDLQRLAIELRDHGQVEVANCLSSFINRLGRQSYVVRPEEF